MTSEEGKTVKNLEKMELADVKVEEKDKDVKLQSTPLISQGQVNQEISPGLPINYHQLERENEFIWMNKPDISGCHTGLEYLVPLDRLIIRQKPDLLQTFVGLETTNEYVIRSSQGLIVFKAKEESSFISRQFVMCARPFVLHITDKHNNEIIHLQRPHRCFCCMQRCSVLDCCHDEIEVQAPVGQVVGHVKQTNDGSNIRLLVSDENHQVKLQIQGPKYCFCSCPEDDVPFKIVGTDESTSVGMLYKKWSNLMQEMFSSAEDYVVQFPIDLDVKMKATLLGAVFLIDFMFFEVLTPI